MLEDVYFITHTKNPNKSLQWDVFKINIFKMGVEDASESTGIPQQKKKTEKLFFSLQR